MRAKRRPRPRGRHGHPNEQIGGLDPADWLMQSEIGWGMPHWLFAVPGFMRQLVIAAERLADRLRHGRRDTPG
jgi:hypothetical protein